MWFSFVNTLFFAYRLLLTPRWKLVEVFMTVFMYHSQQHGWQGQRIDTRHPGRQSQKVRSWLAFFLGKRFWWFPHAFSRCVVKGKLKFLLGFGFIVSLLFYFACTHWNSACVSIASSKFVSLFLNTWEKKNFELRYLLVLLSFTLHFFCIPCSSTRVKISSRMICKATYMYDWVNIHCNILVMDEQIKSKRLCRSLFLRERYAVQLCQKAGRMVARDVEFFFCS